MRRLEEVDIAGKRILVRADYNVELDSGAGIIDDNRVRKSLPTLKYILEHGGKAILMSHLGDPEDGERGEFSLHPVAEKLSELMQLPVKFCPECVGPQADSAVASLKAGEILLLENLRFNPGEKKNSPEFAAQLAKHADVFINDSFASSHRQHASMVGVPKCVKEKAAGLLMQQELDYYNSKILNPKRPICLIMGGIKVSAKLPALVNLAHKVDKLIVGGAMANTFLAAQGLQMGRSFIEPDLFVKSLEILATLARRDCKLYLPVDFLVAPSPGSRGLARAVPALEVPADSMALDIGPATSLLFKEAVHSAETIIWDGPMGACEHDDFSKGTYDLVEHLASAHGVVAACGGQTELVIRKMELSHKFDYISTGGTSFLELFQGKTPPAVTAL